MFRLGRVISVATGFLNRILSLGLAGLILVMLFKPDLLDRLSGENPIITIVANLEGYRLYLALGALILLILNLNIIQFIIYTLWNSNVRHYISSKTTSGTARVSLEAIERALKAAAKGVPEIEKCKLRVYRIGAKRYKVEVRFWCPHECNILNISERLRLILKKRFAELVSIEPDARVFFEVSLAGIRGRSKCGVYSSAGPPKDGIDPSKSQFKGPVYPVDGEL